MDKVQSQDSSQDLSLSQARARDLSKDLFVEVTPEESNLDAFHEECGVFGVFGHPEAANLAYLGMYACSIADRSPRASYRPTASR